MAEGRQDKAMSPLIDSDEDFLVVSHFGPAVPPAIIYPTLQQRHGTGETASPDSSETEDSASTWDDLRCRVSEKLESLSRNISRSDSLRGKTLFMAAFVAVNAVLFTGILLVSNSIATPSFSLQRSASNLPYVVTIKRYLPVAIGKAQICSLSLPWGGFAPARGADTDNAMTVCAISQSIAASGPEKCKRRGSSPPPSSWPQSLHAGCPAPRPVLKGSTSGGGAAPSKALPHGSPHRSPLMRDRSEPLASLGPAKGRRARPPPQSPPHEVDPAWSCARTPALSALDRRAAWTGVHWEDAQENAGSFFVYGSAPREAGQLFFTLPDCRA